MNVSIEVQDILNAAYQEARIKQHEFITPEHILYAALHFPYTRGVMEACGANADKIREDVLRHLGEKVPAVANSQPDQSVLFQNVITRAALHSEATSQETIEMGDILVSMFEEEKSYCSYFMKKAGITRLSILEVISHIVGRSETQMREIQGFDSDDDLTGSESSLDGDASFVSDPDRSDDDQPEGSVSDGSGKPTKADKALAMYARDLVAMARKGELEPLIGREDVLERTIQILCRRLKNNPVHLGQPGVGKTAISEGLAQRIATGDVPELLKDFKLFSLDIGSILAGTRFRGDFEERIKQVLKAVEQQPKTILFIDEIHTLIGAGATSGGSMDASNLLKPALSTGKLRVIGATTQDEYRKFMERDRAFSRRFQTIEIQEPSQAETVLILKGLKSKYEEYHQVVYPDDQLELMVTLAAQYVNERFFPDKAIDIMDECGALLRMKSFKAKPVDATAVVAEVSGVAASGTEVTNTEASVAAPLVVDAELVEKVVSSIARVPVRTVSVTEKDRLKGLEADLRKSIFGQDQAIQAVVDAIKRSRAGFRKAGKPVANFLFVGPTGVGKTEIARQLAASLGVEFLRFDMSEYQERHSVSRLIGSPPGYVGYDEGGLLTETIRQKPHAVLLLDEVEKAHADIFNVLLQVLDYATLTDNSGRKADFRNVIIIMTSNAGARDIGKASIGFGAGIASEHAMQDAVEKLFTPEFRNRLDRVVTFNHLAGDHIHAIVRKEIREFEAQLLLKQVTLQIDDAVIPWLADKGYSASFGARNIARVVDDQLRSLFIDEVLFGSLAEGGHAVVTLEEGSIKASFTAPIPPEAAGS